MSLCRYPWFELIQTNVQSEDQKKKFDDQGLLKRSQLHFEGHYLEQVLFCRLIQDSLPDTYRDSQAIVQ